MLKKTIIILGSLITLGVMGIPALAGTCKLETTISKTGTCPTGSYFIGPLKATEHWGTCLKAVNCESGLHIKTTNDRATCTEEKRTKNTQRYVYAGANRANEHRGHCIMFKSNRIAVRAEEKRFDKICNTYGSGVYVGPNDVKEHWGTCLYVAKHGSFVIDNGTNAGAIKNSKEHSRWLTTEKEKVEKEKAERKREKDKANRTVAILRGTNDYKCNSKTNTSRTLVNWTNKGYSVTVQTILTSRHFVEGQYSTIQYQLAPNKRKFIGCATPRLTFRILAANPYK